jgi:uncharacterized RDD family membrane protein YckC
MNTGIVAAPVFAGAWRRIGAFVIDAVLLGVGGVLAGYFLFDFFVDLGSSGRLLGFAIALAYFAPLNSRIGSGQTLGKRLLKIRVVGADGAALSLPKAALRFAVLGIPWFLNNAWFSAEVLKSPLVYVLTAVIFGVGLSIIYLFLFNRPTRQSLHDLFVGSYVVQAESTGTFASAPMSRVHLGIVAALVVLTAAVPIYTTRLAAKEPFAPLLDVYRSIVAEPGVVYAGVNKGWTSRASVETTYLQVTAYLTEFRIDDAELAARLARRAIKADPSAMKVDTVQVDLVYGYDIGIASAHRSQTHGNTPAGWLAVKGDAPR